MNIIGIICEYNPFHNGHLYHLERIKNMYPDSLIVLVLSGYFTERGDVSLLNKFDKTSIALKYGVDIVLELPALYAVNSADVFASSAIQILSYCGVEKIVFGSESADVSLLKNLAKKQLESDSFNEAVRAELSRGVNYPTALARALGVNLKSNDLLGIAYIKAIIDLNLDIEPIAIKRTNDFNDIASENRIVSAQNIREKLNNGQNIDKFIPSYSTEAFNNIDEEKIFQLLKYRIITDNHLNCYLGMDEGLENRFKKEILKSSSYNDFIERVKSKRYTTLRIKRLCIHVILGIEKQFLTKEISCARILGINNRGREYLKTHKNAKILFNDKNISGTIERRSSYIYDLLTGDKTLERELSNKPIIRQ